VAALVKLLPRSLYKVAGLPRMAQKVPQAVRKASVPYLKANLMSRAPVFRQLKSTGQTSNLERALFMAFTR
jgi:hypothetical protein